MPWLLLASSTMTSSTHPRVAVGIVFNLFYDPTIGTTTPTVTRTTGPDGIASFKDIQVIKAGGYEFLATATFDATLTGPAARSVMANFQGK